MCKVHNMVFTTCLHEMASLTQHIQVLLILPILIGPTRSSPIPIPQDTPIIRRLPAAPSLNTAISVIYCALDMTTPTKIATAELNYATSLPVVPISTPMTPRARVIPNTEPKPLSDKPALAFLFLTLIFPFMGITLLVHWTIKEHVRLGKLDKAAAMTKSAAETFVVGEDSDTEARSSGNRDSPIGQLDANATSGKHAAKVERRAVREAELPKKLRVGPVISLGR